MTKHIKRIIYTIMATVAIIACTENNLERADYVAFQGTAADVEAPLAGSASSEVKVYTTTKTGSDRTFAILVDATSTADPASYTVPATVTVPANSNVGTIAIQANATGIGKNIILKFQPTDIINTGTSITLNVVEQCLENLMYLDVLFDNYPEEFAWQILDKDGNLAAGNDDFGYYNGLKKKQIRLRVCLPAGAYTFTAYDLYGDGLSDGTNIGWFALRKVSDGSTIASGTGGDWVTEDYGNVNFEFGSKAVQFTLP